MNLQEFISNSLLQILSGVSKARQVNPLIGGGVTALGKQEFSCTMTNGQAGFLVEFDVAVMASEKTDKEAAGGIEVVRIVKVGGQVSAASEQATENRIRFCVPIVFSSLEEDRKQMVEDAQFNLSMRR
jgi:hypothetical protein